MCGVNPQLQEFSAYATISSMKNDIHPAYHKEAKARCACGAKFTFGSTKPEIQVEICAKCHPFFTGEEKLIDTAGRVEKFKTRRAKAVAPALKKPRAKTANKT